MRIGLTPDGEEIELVGALLTDRRWLIFHALTTPTKKVCKEIDKALMRKR